MAVKRRVNKPSWWRGKQVPQTLDTANDTWILGFPVVLTIRNGTHFAAKKRFVINTAERSLPMIEYIDQKFKDFFLAGEGKIEAIPGDQFLRYARVYREGSCSRIIKELGGQKKIQTQLYHLYFLLERQGQRQDGVLNIGGWSNMFFIRNLRDKLSIVYVSWRQRGWHFYAELVADRKEEIARGSTMFAPIQYD